MATAVLGNNQEFDGESTFQSKDFLPTLLPLAYPGCNVSDSDVKYCIPATLNNTNVTGKIVLYEDGSMTDLTYILGVQHKHQLNIQHVFRHLNVLSSPQWHCSSTKKCSPDWSPGAIESAIMTTANVLNLGSNLIEDQKYLPADVFATSDGHVNPSNANVPSLI
ncbi:putative subtilisin-like protease-like [Capsicum annuum]|uniref:Uncharacterized protein n=1 Tax=Capsicum annuum TaxID=4072 RepID=A0A2G3AE70_CAPAN|nr:putative subtilisin-like protease-like [Capsicum annuum]KAF3614753.1 putative subtilisin-like protease-like [Capsicum annuum]PHT92539.1 hypothetical protein T459_00421 [Capsicum annuum]